MRKCIVLVLLIICSPLTLAYAQNLTHIVRAGETLTSIAAEYGVSVDAIVTANKLTDQNAIYVGQRLVIPVQTPNSANNAAVSATSPTSLPGTYTVQPRDTLYGIANKLGVSPDALMSLNKLADPAVLQIGLILKIPGAAESAASQAGTGIGTTLPDGSQTVVAPVNGPAISYQILHGRLVSLILQTTSTGKQSFPLSCESKVAGQIAAMYGLPFDEVSFLSSLPRSLNPRQGFVGSPDGRFYLPRDLIGNSANGPGGYGVSVEGWSPTFQTLSGFGVHLLASDIVTAGAQIDNALRRGEPVAIWAVLGFQENIAARSVWLGRGADGTAIDCGGPGQSCSYLVSGEHTYLLIGRVTGSDSSSDSYVLYNPGSGQIEYRSRTMVLNGITNFFAVPTGSSPGAIIIPTPGHLPDLSQLPGW